MLNAATSIPRSHPREAALTPAMIRGGAAPDLV
jgi:hypothetical protein